MAAPSEPLVRLATRRGLALQYRTATGAEVEVSDATLRSILLAMGLAAATDDDVVATEARLAALAADRRIAPTVVLSTDGDPVAAPVIAPVAVSEVAYRLTLEDGSVREATVPIHRADPGWGNPLPEAGQVPLGVVPHGYHSLHIPALQADPVHLVVAPTRCYLPAATWAGERMVGVAAQSYLLRSARNWGIGDGTDLKALAAAVAATGYDLLGINPLHLLFPDRPDYASPYAPASRLLLNTLMIDPTALAEYGAASDIRAEVEGADFQARLAALRDAPLVDYIGVAAVKYPVLRRLFDHFQAAADPDRQSAFDAFKRAGGRILATTALFLVLRRHFADGAGHGTDWSNWPVAYRDPSSPAVRAFAAEHAEDVEFEIFLQFAADEQFAAAAAAGEGMRVGLYRDLAVGCDTAGAETWVDQRAVIKSLSVGAPPDYFTPAGQNWALPPFDPIALAEDGYHSFIALVRANMRHAGALRIDHVMGLARLFCIPSADGPAEGTYLAYPLEDLIGILALESHRHHCLVVGEDLGVVPHGFRDRMAAACILSYRVMLFEQDGWSHAFNPPDWYPWLSVAVTGSHDLPTLRGWWTGVDLDIKETLAILPDAESVAAARAQRDTDRQKLAEMLRNAGVLAPGDGLPDVETFTAAAMAFPRRASSALALVQLDDLLGETEPVNVPGTTLAYPNWRRRYRADAASVLGRPAGG